MDTSEELRKFLEDLIEVLHLQVKELEKLISHIAQQATYLGHKNQLPLVVSELSELHQRIKKL